MTLFAGITALSVAIAFVFFIGVLEMISLIFIFLSGALDAHLAIIMTPCHHGCESWALHYLNIGRVPAAVVLCLLAGYFRYLRYPHRHGGIMLWQSAARQSAAGPLKHCPVD